MSDKEDEEENLDKHEEEGEKLEFRTKEEIFDAFEQFKKDTQTGWRCFSTKAKFGKILNMK